MGNYPLPGYKGAKAARNDAHRWPKRARGRHETPELKGKTNDCDSSLTAVASVWLKYAGVGVVGHRWINHQSGGTNAEYWADVPDFFNTWNLKHR